MSCGLLIQFGRRMFGHRGKIFRGFCSTDWVSGHVTYLYSSFYFQFPMGVIWFRRSFCTTVFGCLGIYNLFRCVVTSNFRSPISGNLQVLELRRVSQLECSLHPTVGDWILIKLNFHTLIHTQTDKNGSILDGENLTKIRAKSFRLIRTWSCEPNNTKTLATGISRRANGFKKI